MAHKIVRRDVLVGAATSVAALAISIKNGSAAKPKTHEVTIDSFEFDPMRIVANIGDTIRWTNRDLAPHTATAIEGGWDTGEIVKGDHRSIVVSEGMETNYHCAFHPHMKGAIELK